MLNKRIKQLLGFVIFILRLHKLLIGNRALVVAFHRVSDEALPSSINCPPQDFRRYCKFFRKYFEVVELSVLLRRLRAGEPTRGLVAITFDDGYKDNATIAAPILKRMALPATFFITTNFIASQTQAFWDVDHGVESIWMNWDDVRQLDADNFDIGGHTQNHVDLAKVEFSLARTEIAGCRDRIEHEIGKIPQHFAYPFGGKDHITADTRKEVMRSGFECCMSCCSGLVSQSDSTDDLSREAITTWHLSPYQFGFEFIQRALHRG